MLTASMLFAPLTAELPTRDGRDVQSDKTRDLDEPASPWITWWRGLCGLNTQAPSSVPSVIVTAAVVDDEDAEALAELNQAKQELAFVREQLDWAVFEQEILTKALARVRCSQVFLEATAHERREPAQENRVTTRQRRRVIRFHRATAKRRTRVPPQGWLPERH
ncbi:hypothetical protein PINS_up024041 [Pythium insidiosum]|nr:hypothetical protein PINS_up024041 [Pythium insidiosum]